MKNWKLFIPPLETPQHLSWQAIRKVVFQLLPTTFRGDLSLPLARRTAWRLSSVASASSYQRTFSSPFLWHAQKTCAMFANWREGATYRKKKVRKQNFELIFMIIMQLSFRVSWAGEETKWNKQIMSFLRFASFFSTFFLWAKVFRWGWKIGPESWVGARANFGTVPAREFLGDGFVFLGEVDSRETSDKLKFVVMQVIPIWADCSKTT